MSILSDLKLHPCLRARLHQYCSRPKSTSAASATLEDIPPSNSKNINEGFVLYLPTVCLRHDQNPSFALACHAANHLNVPLVVLAVVVDDASHARAARPHRFPPPTTTADDDNNALSPSVVMTSRRLAFTLQALSHACTLWSSHGAAVGIRIHAGTHPNLTGARTPDHLTLATRASFVVMDEPFVSPFTTLVHRVEEACRKSSVDCVRVDGSCTVPPVQVLKKRNADIEGCVKYDGVPSKAYLWQRKTEHTRASHLEAAMEGGFDAPELAVTMKDEDLFASTAAKLEGDSTLLSRVASTRQHSLAHLFPLRWKLKCDTDAGNKVSSCSLPSAPDVRPFTSSELSDLYHSDSNTMSEVSQTRDSETTRNDNRPFHNFALNWPGADPTVPPCPQIIGTTTQGMRRWNNFLQNRLTRYGKDRNDARNVHAPSRMSAYLNLGIVSIFRVVGDVKRAQKEQCGGGSGGTKSYNRWNKSGADKFEEEIVKWREMSYAHAFSRDDCDGVGCVPLWSVAFLNKMNKSRCSIESLANGTTKDAKWNAMQQYLVRSGELHNNVRMTWGKTVVEWGGCSVPPCTANDGDMMHPNPAQITLRTLCYLNDRYALDGLSPPSYAGLLWCMGWTDKPSGNGGIGMKPASRYKMTPEQFRMAESKLLADTQLLVQHGGPNGGRGVALGGMKRPRSVSDMMKMQSSSSESKTTTSKTASRGSADGKSELKNDAFNKLMRTSSSLGMKRRVSSTIDLTDDPQQNSFPPVTKRSVSSTIDLTDDSKPSSLSPGTKRSGSSTISSFFSKDPKKQKKEYSRVVC